MSSPRSLNTAAIQTALAVTACEQKVDKPTRSHDTFADLMQQLVIDEDIYPEKLRTGAIRTQYVKHMEDHEFDEVAAQFYNFYQANHDQEPIKSLLDKLQSVFKSIDQSSQEASPEKIQAKKYLDVADDVEKLLTLRENDFVKQREKVLEKLKSLEDEFGNEFKNAKSKLADTVLFNEKHFEEKIVRLYWGRSDVIKDYYDGKFDGDERKNWKDYYNFNRHSLDLCRVIGKHIHNNEYDFLRLKRYLDTSHISMRDNVELEAPTFFEFYLRFINFSDRLESQGVKINCAELQLVLDQLQRQVDSLVEIAMLRDELRFLAVTAYPHFDLFYNTALSIFANKDTLNNSKMFVAARALGLCALLYDDLKHEIGDPDFLEHPIVHINSLKVISQRKIEREVFARCAPRDSHTFFQHAALTDVVCDYLGFSSIFNDPSESVTPEDMEFIAMAQSLRR